jgi:ketosteroid isomerase-like protein
VISVVTSRGRGRESGIDVEQTHYALWAFDAGKVTSVRWFGTRDEALEAAGRPE